MHRLRPWLGFLLLVAVAPPLSGRVQQVVRWTATVEPTATLRPGGQVEVVLQATIDPGWKLYALTQAGAGPQALTITLAEGSPVSPAGTIITPLPFSAFDSNFNIETQYHTADAAFYVPLQLPPVVSTPLAVSLDVTWQTCTDRFCLPPSTERISLVLPVPGTGADVRVITAPAQAQGRSSPVEDMATIAGDGTLRAYLGLAALMGALSLLTPCVFPMVPITVSYFTGRAQRDPATARRHALVYGVGIVTTFTLVGIVAAVGFGAAGLNQFAASPWLNVAIAALFVGFACNLLGWFDLSLPSSWLTAVAGSGRRLPPLAATALMALVFTLTSFTCTAPFLGTLLVVAAQGDWVWPMGGLLVFASVFALPFVALAWAPQALTVLPRSGAWMLAVKACMGLLELAAALKFLSNADLIWGWGLFTRNAVIALWVAIGAVLAAYLVGGLRLGHAPRLTRPGALRLGLALATLALTIWMSTGLTGRRLGELEAFLPPDPLGRHAGELSWIVNDYDAALADARASGRPLLIDFTGYTCTNCRWMEANMFPEPAVARELSRYVRVRLYTDGRGDDSRRFQAMQRDTFGTVALPYYAALTPAGVPKVAFGGLTRDRGHFVAFLQRGAQ